MDLFETVTTVGLLGIITFILMKVAKDIVWLLDDMENKDEGDD